MKRAITILEKGMFTTVQDEGRSGYAYLGVPESGAMDKVAMRLGNRLMNNLEDSAVLECTLVGPTIRFEVDCHFVLTGSSSNAYLDGVSIKVGEAAFAKAKQILSIKKIHPGVRTYLTIAGGMLVNNVLGSRSSYPPLTPTYVIKNQLIALGTSLYGSTKFTRIKRNNDLLEHNFSFSAIPVYAGPEFEYLSTQQQKKLFEMIFTISKNWNRMAMQLEEQLKNGLASIFTAPVIPGTVQLTPSGTQIILCNDCQTTGGYPRILQVSSIGMQLLSQMGAGQKLRWKLVQDRFS